jgi:hypothetical protein
MLPVAVPDDVGVHKNASSPPELVRLLPTITPLALIPQALL